MKIKQQYLSFEAIPIEAAPVAATAPASTEQQYDYFDALETILKIAKQNNQIISPTNLYAITQALIKHHGKFFIKASELNHGEIININTTSNSEPLNQPITPQRFSDSENQSNFKNPCKIKSFHSTRSGAMQRC